MSGFFLTNTTGLWALAVLAAVVVLYLFYRRYRPLPVTGLFLWGDPRRDGMGGRKVENPLFTRPFWLDMLAAALFALALAGPAWRSEGLPVAIILDDSFAMRALGAYRDAGRQAAAVVAEAAKGGRDGAIIMAGPRARLWRGMGRLARGEAEAVLADYLPSERSADLQAAVRLAEELFGSDVEVHVFTNRDDAVPTPAKDGAVVLHVLPGRGGNLVFAAAWREPDSATAGGERVIVSIVNHTAAATGAVFEIRTDAREHPRILYTEEISFAPGETVQREVLVAAAGGETLVLALHGDGEDVISEDSLAYLPPVPNQTLTYALDGLDADSSRYYRLALEAAGARPAVDAASADLLVTADGGREGRAITLEVAPEDRLGLPAPPYVVDYASALCRDVDLSAIVWVAATPRHPGRIREVYIAGGGLPLYWSSTPRRMHLNVSVAKGDLAGDPSWPVLMANLVAYGGRMLPGLRQSLYRPGELLRYNAPVGQAPRFRMIDAEGRETFGLTVPKNPGLYDFREGDTAIGDIAVAPLYGPGSDATRLAGTADTIRLGTVREDGARGVLDLTWIALALGMAALALNWRGKTA